MPGQPHIVGIAILDTGLYGNHPDLPGNFVACYDAVTNANSNGSVLTEASQVGTNRDPNGHGSHLAGTAASTNKAIDVASGAGIIGVRVLPAPGENPRHDTLTTPLSVAVRGPRLAI